MAQKHGKGKESFRRFTKSANTLRDMVIGAIINGQQYTTEEVNYWFTEILYQYEAELETEKLDVELWFSRATDKVSELIVKLFTDYPNAIRDYSEPDSDDDYTGSPVWGDEDELPTIYGFPVISDDDCRAGRNATGKPGNERGQVLVTLEELEEYLSEIPSEYIGGIIPQYDDDNRVRGFTVCVESAKKKKRSK